MLVVEIDAVDLETLQAGFTSSPHIGRIATDLSLPISKVDSEFCRKLNLLPHPSLQSLFPRNIHSISQPKLKIHPTPIIPPEDPSILAIGTQQYQKATKIKGREAGDLGEEKLVGVRAVDIGGVEKGDAGVDGMVDERNHVGLGLWRALDSRHAHAS